MMSTTGEVPKHEEGEQDQSEDMVGLRSQDVEYFDNTNKYRFSVDSSGRKKPRFLLDLMVSDTDPEENIAEELCEKLYETKSELILRIVQVIGGEKAIELFKATQQLEKAGGMMIKKGTRRRTSGGVFLFLLTRDTSLPQEMIKQIMEEDRIKYLCKIKTLREKTCQIVAELLQQKLTDTEKPSASCAEAIVQSEQRSNLPPSPDTEASDYLSDTDTRTDDEVDILMGQAGAHICDSDAYLRDTISTTSQLELPCVLCALEKNRREQQDQSEDMVGLRSQDVEYFDNTNEYRFSVDSSGRKKPRFLLDLMVSDTDPEENIAEELCEKLYETKSELILRIVQVIGGEKAIELFKATQQLEKAGGMMVKKGTRRRTSGSVFLFLLTRDTSLPQEMIKQILKEDRIKYLSKIKTLREKTCQSVAELLQQKLTDSEKPSVSRAGAIVQSEQGSSLPPSPDTEASDYLSDTDTYTDDEVDIPMGQAGANICDPDANVRDTISTTPQQELPCVLCAMEKNRREQVAFIQYLYNTP